MLRRYLVDEGFLQRADGIYWRSGGTVVLEAARGGYGRVASPAASRSSVTSSSTRLPRR
jgi:hypothetical protein